MPVTDDVFFDDLLAGRALALRDTYANAQPWPHVVIDAFLPDDAAERAVAAWPTDPNAWVVEPTDGGRRVEKHSLRAGRSLDPWLRHLLAQTNGAAMLRFLADLTGVRRLVGDPFVEECLREYHSGGRLEVHTDFAQHFTLGLSRRINVILYLTPGWDPSWSGALELCAPGSDAPAAAIAPLFNRAVIFETSAMTPHGFPSPLQTPAGVARRSLNLYYYSPDASSAPAARGTTWSAGRRHSMGDTARRVARDWVPPVVLRGALRLRDRARRQG